MAFILILIIAFIGYYFYNEKIIKPKSIIKQDKIDEEYFKICLIINRHPIMKDKFKKFAEHQQARINTEGSSWSEHPTEMGNSVKIFKKTVKIFSNDDVRNFEFEIRSSFKQLESDESQRKIINSIVEDCKDFWKKETAESNIERNNFHLLYLNQKHLLDSIFPERRINRTTFENYSTKTKEEIIEEIVILKGISKDEAVGVFQELTSTKFGKRILRIYKDKYYLDDEKTLFDY